MAPIELVCDERREHDPEGPLVTVISGEWGYCAGGRTSDHRRRRIRPTRIEYVQTPEISDGRDEGFVIRHDPMTASARTSPPRRASVIRA